MKSRKKKIQIALITSFRLLLWWSAEAAKNLFVFRKPGVQIQQVQSLNTEFPFSSWILTRQSVYCLSTREGKRDVVIHRTGTLSDN
jgi:hypothetical protein